MSRGCCPAFFPTDICNIHHRRISSRIIKITVYLSYIPSVDVLIRRKSQWKICQWKKNVRAVLRNVPEKQINPIKNKKKHYNIYNPTLWTLMTPTTHTTPWPRDNSTMIIPQPYDQPTNGHWCHYCHPLSGS